MIQTLAFAPPRNEQRFSLSFACRVARESILCFGPMDYSILQSDQVELNGNHATSLRLGTVLDDHGTRYTLFIFTFPNNSGLEFVDEITIRRDSDTAVIWKAPHVIALPNSEQSLPGLLSSLSEEKKSKAFFLLSRLMDMKPAVMKDPVYTRALSGLRPLLGGNKLPVQTFWPSSRLLCLDVPVLPNDWVSPRLYITNGSSAYSAPLTPCLPWIEKPSKDRARHLLCAWFGKDIPQRLRAAQLAIVDGNRIIPCTMEAPLDHITIPAKLPAYVNSFEEHRRPLLREAIAALLCSQMTEDNQKEIHDLLFNLRHFVRTPHTSITDIAEPIGCNMEHVFPIGSDWLFISGWLRDPLRQIETFEAVSDLGIRVPIGRELHHYPRQDVHEIYAPQGASTPQENQGIIALVPLPEALRTDYADIAPLSQYRFHITLRSGVEYSIGAPAAPHSDQLKRDALLNGLVSPVAGHGDAETILAEALAKLQESSTHSARVAQNVSYGEPVAYPAISVVIPVYGNTEFAQTQIAHFANDPFFSTCEVLYVLDDPAQEAAFDTLLSRCHSLYGLPLKLLVLDNNYGYATACNLGARHAEGTHLCFLNSDVLPHQYGWLERLWIFYNQQEDQIGALGPTLLFDNQSIQHAGMHYRCDSPSGHAVSIEHYGKGRGMEWLKNKEPERVPAVTGACMMLEKTLFEDTGGFDGQFIFGDFEDAHLCMKLEEKGRRNYYFPDVLLYHFERQSVPLQTGYRDNAVFPMNAHRFYTRWEKRLPQPGKLADNNDNFREKPQK